MKRIRQVRQCYNQTALEYAKQFSAELDGKPLDRLLLRRFAHENVDKGPMVDLGCGSGHTTAFLFENGVKNVIGIDLSAEMVKVAQQHNDPAIQFAEGNMLKLDYPDQYFGSILAMYAIVHFDYEEIRLVAQEMNRILNPLGQILLSFHCGDEVVTLDEFLGKSLKVEFQYFNPDRVIQLFESGGFRLVEGFIRYPYKGKEYPSRRAYLLFEKN